MNGLRVQLEIGGDREDVFFATRRSGAAGTAMRKAQVEFRRLRFAASRVAARMTTQAARLDQAGESAGIELFEEIDRVVAKLAEEAQDLAEQARGHAEQFVRLSLGENYGDEEIARFLGNLTDSQLAQIVGIVETGAVPADFFPARAIPPSESTTSPLAGSPGASSSSTDSPGPTSKPAT